MKKGTYRKRNVILSFIIPIIVLIGVFYYREIFINSTNSILFSDLSNVYADLLMGLKNEILAGNTILYNWNFAGGNNFIPVVTGNLSSILNIFIFLFPDKYFQEIILVLQLLRIGFSGANMYLYLSYHFKKDDVKMIGIAVSYGLSAYMVCFFQHIMWFDSVMLLPLVILLTEKLLIEKKLLNLKFIFGLVILYWSNFYIGYMISIFIFLYSLGFLYKERINRRVVLYQVLKIIVNGIMAAGICAIFLLPTAFPLIGSGEFVTIRMYLRCSITDLLYQMYLGNFDTYLPGGRPLLYCGIFTIILLIVYVKSELVSKREKIANLAILVVLVLSIEVAPLYFMWHLFDNPDWFEVRFSFILIFYMLFLSYKTMNRWEQVKKKEFLVSGSLVAVIFYFCTKIYSDLDIEIIIVNYIFISLYILFSEVLVKNKRRDIILIFIIVGELVINTNIVVENILQTEPTENYQFYNEFLEQNKEIVSSLNEIDSGFYRIEKDYYRRENDLVAAGGKGISAFVTFFNKEFNKMLSKFGMTSADKIIRYEGSTVVTDALLGIKYVCSQWGYYSVYEHFKEIAGRTIFKNNYAFDLGTMVNRELAEINIDIYDNPIMLQNEIMKKMYGRTENVFQGVSPKEIKLTNLSREIIEDEKIVYTKINPWEEASIELKIDKCEGYLVYAYFSKDCGDVSLWLNGMWLSNFLGQTGKVLNLENNTYGSEEITIKILVNGEKCEMDSKIFYLLDLNLISEFFEASDFATIEKFSTTDIELIAKLQKKQLLLLSIPYDKGWHIDVEGKKVETKPVLGGLIGIELEEGVHEIRLRYIPEGLILGGIISICFGVILLFYVIQENYKKKERRRDC